MEGKRLIKSLRLKNLLSYGEAAEPIELQPLNVLIGPNGSGKSNLIEAIGLLHATPENITRAIRGGVTEWLWKGGKGETIAEIEAIVDYPDGPVDLRYLLSFAEFHGLRLKVVDEIVANAKPLHDEEDVRYFLRYEQGSPVVSSQRPPKRARTEKGQPRSSVKWEMFDLTQSVLSQRKDPGQYPEITYLGRQFGAIRLYREWHLGRDASPRNPQPADLPEDCLEEDAGNLSLVLNDLENRPAAKQRILKNLRAFYGRIGDFHTKVSHGTVNLYLHEESPEKTITIPATRISDGTLRYLCLLTILCHPEPPPLVCIEEPELGLHPDVLPTVAQLLIDASQRTQLIVTTHSDMLVSALTDVPECVLVCEHDQSGTHVRRLEKEKLEKWLEKYTLGELWQMGEIGGNL